MADNAWSSTGVRTWHKMSSHGAKEKGKLGKHFSSIAHKATLANFYAFGQDQSNNGILLDKEKRVKAIHEKHDQLTNQEAVTYC